MANYCVYVKCIEKRYVEAEDPIDAVSKALHNMESVVEDMVWDWDTGIEHITFIDEHGEKRVVMSNKRRGEINHAVRNANKQKNMFTGESWEEIRKRDFKEMDTIHIRNTVDGERYIEKENPTHTDMV